jgi:O-antigen/teichoic acid export membrane protein
MTETPEPTILARTARGANWMVAWRFANRVLGLVSMLVLLRLLAPEDFGLITLAFSFSQALETFTALGVEAQIIRSRNADRDLYDTGFTFNALRAALLAVLVAAGSGPVSAWFGEPRLRALLLAIAAHVFIKGIGSIRTVAFQRDLAFHKVFILQMAPRLVQIVVNIVFAVLLRNYWAIIIGTFAWGLSGLVIGYVMAPYRPRLTFVAWRELLGVSVWTWLINIAVVIRDRTEMAIIGRSFGTVAAGLFSIATELAALPVTELVSPISQVAMPGFAAGIREHGMGQAGVAFLRVVGLATLLAVPTGAGASLVSGPFVALAIGDRWAEAAPLMAVIALLMVPTAPGLIAGALLTARAQLRTLCAITTVAALLRAGLVIVVTRHIGLMGVALGMGLLMTAENTALVMVACRTGQVPPARLLGTFWRPLGAALAMVAALSAAGLAWMPLPASALAAAEALAVTSLLGAAVFATVLAALWWLAGKPRGPETDAMLMGHRSLAGIAAKLGRRSR